MAMVDNLAMYSPTSEFKQKGGDRVYVDWNEHVSDLAKGREAGYLEFNVKQGWEPLCSFLGVDVPDVPFPRLNDKQEFLKLWELEEKKNYEIVDWRVWAVAAASLTLSLLFAYLL